jgi:hypothetical protein
MDVYALCGKRQRERECVCVCVKDMLRLSLKCTKGNHKRREKARAITDVHVDPSSLSIHLPLPPICVSLSSFVL